MTVEYPPLAPLGTYPLHAGDGVGWACMGGDSYDWRCPDCVAHAKAEVAAGRDMAHPIRFEANQQQVLRSTSWLVERSEALRATQ